VRYLAAVTSIVIGIFLFFGSVVAGIGVHLPGSAWGILVGAVGIACLFFSVWAVRDSVAEPLFRGVVSVILALGSVQLITGFGMLGLAIRGGFDNGGFDSGATIYSIGFGAICVAALLVINYDAWAGHGQDRKSPPSISGG
jgi:hypothetical protein